MNNDDLCSFGSLLRAFRKSRKRTQQQLAEAVGVHRNAISHWEQGDFLPATRGMVLELARYLQTDEPETRRLLEASLTTLSPYWLVPFPRNPFFTGREKILEALHAQLSIPIPAALSGLGGIGKTQIALEYAYHHALEYHAVFWIGAETAESIVASLLHIAEVLQFPSHDKDQRRIIGTVQRWLLTHDRWLVIWDNGEDLDLLERFLLSTRSGSLLITTRSQTLGTLAQGLDVSPMEQEEGVLFLLRRARMLEPRATSAHVHQFAARLPDHSAAATEVVTALGRLPLALDQAGAYLEETHCGLPTYLELFHTRQAALLQQRGEKTRDHPTSVFTTFTMAITATTQHHPAVRDLLQVCALLQPDAIPEELFRQGSAYLGASLQTVSQDTLEWNKIVAAACAHSLLSRQAEEQTLSLHWLVQVVLLDMMTKAERKQWTKRTIEALDAAFPELLPATEHAEWKLGKRLLSHARLCLNRAEMANESLALASLAYKVAQYLRTRGSFEEAEPFFQRALRIREQALGPNHPDVARVLHYLALLYWFQGKYAASEPLYQRALHIREQTLGPDHPDVARVLNNLAALYWNQGKYALAEPLYQQALQIWKNVQIPAHSDLASLLNNLALLQRDRGKYEQAEPLWKQALQIWEQTVGPDHPLVAQALNNLALLYYQQGKDIKAEPLFQHALYLLEQAVGSDHPERVQALNNLAHLYRSQGKNTEAESLYRQALQINEQSQRADHPDVAQSLTGLANLFLVQEKNAEAELLFQRALRIQEKRLGPQHPRLAQTLLDLALFRRKEDKRSEALALAERVLRIREQSLGETHPHTIAIQALHARLLQEQMGTQQIATSEEITDLVNQALLVERSSGPRLTKDALSAQNHPLQDFIRARCELHPYAWCRSTDLWEAYKQWVQEQNERFPLSRRAMASQLKTLGCSADRTATARIWRGITLAGKQKMTRDDVK